MRRRAFLETGAAAALLAGSGTSAPAGIDPVTRKEWLERWEKNILQYARERRCDTETGEEIGWLISPYLNGFYYGYLATREMKWVEMLVDWTDSWIRRGTGEPDGFTGWPKENADGHPDGRYGDSMLGEAMALRPVVLMASEILKDSALGKKFADKARRYLDLAGRIFEKWDSRGCWRPVKEGGVWVETPFGIDRQSGKWTVSYAARKTGGFTHPDNKENEIARWMLAMHDVTKKPVYRDRAEGWFRVMQSRMKTREGGKYFVWNYWEPAGPWDYKSDGSPKHWVGVHPNGGYYQIDVAAIVAAYEHGLVFTREDIRRLIATNRDFMWNHEIRGARFRRIDGGEPDPRWKNSPGVLWHALAPHDATLRNIFITNHRATGWGAMSATPWAVLHL